MYSAAEGYCSYTTITSCCLLYSRGSIVVLSNTIIESVAVLSFPEQLGYQGNSFCAWTRGTARLTPARKCWLLVNFSQPSYYICTQPCFPTEWFRFISSFCKCLMDKKFITDIHTIEDMDNTLIWKVAQVNIWEQEWLKNNHEGQLWKQIVTKQIQISCHVATRCQTL